MNLTTFFDIVILSTTATTTTTTTVQNSETLASEFRIANRKAKADALKEGWTCKYPTVVWNDVKEEDEYSGPPCMQLNPSSCIVCRGCGSNIANNAHALRESEMRRTGEVQAPIEKYFWHRIIADESHVLKDAKNSNNATVCMLVR